MKGDSFNPLTRKEHMNIYTIFTDCLFLALHLIPLAINCVSDLSLWLANRFRTESNTCEDVRIEKQTLVFYTPNHAPLLLSPNNSRSSLPPLSQYLGLNQETKHIHIHVHLESPNKWIRPAHATWQGDFIASMSQDSPPWTTNDDFKLTRYRPNGNTRFIARSCPSHKRPQIRIYGFIHQA